MLEHAHPSSLGKNRSFSRFTRVDRVKCPLKISENNEKKAMKIQKKITSTKI